MLTKVIKYGVISTVVVLAAGGVLFGTDIFSYLSTSARQIRTSAKDAVPLEFELERARDLLGEIVPEMHANVRLIAQEEVAIEGLKADIARCGESLEAEQAKIERLGTLLGEGGNVFRIGGRRYDRPAVKADLKRRFDRYKEAEVVLAGKKRLLAQREKSLSAAVAALEKARGRKAILADRIESLSAQNRLIQAAQVHSKFQVDSSKLAQTQKLIDEIKGRLDVAERVLAHEGRFVDEIEVDVIDEADLLEQVRDHFDGAAAGEPAPALAAETN